ncbi:MAG: Ig-like domain-containing protein [Bacteroidales bacterium]
MQTLKTFLSRIYVFLLVMLLPLALRAQLTVEGWPQKDLTKSKVAQELNKIEKQQIANFRNPNATIIPSQGRKLKDFAHRDFNSSTHFVEMKSMADHPILSKKYKVPKTSSNLGVDTLKEFNTLTNATWGTGVVIDEGIALNFTQDFTISFLYGMQAYYKATTITLLDENLDSLKSFTVSTPDSTQQIEVIGAFSKKYFNNDDKIEIMIKVHGFASEFWGQGPIGCRDTIVVVNEDGEIIRKYGEAAGASIDQFGNTKRLSIFKVFYDGLQDSLRTDVYDPKKADTKTPLFIFSKYNGVFNYSGGPVFAPLNVGGKDYFISSFYEKSFDSLEDPANAIVRKDNKFVIQMYDVVKGGLAKEIKLPLIGQANHEWSMSDLSSFEDIMFTTTTFNTDSLIEIIYGMSRYFNDCDCNRSDLYLVNENGEILQEIIKRTGGTVKLQNIPGQTDEYAVFMGGEGSIESIQMMEMPSMNLGTNFPASYEGDFLSLSFERIATAKGSREYVFGLGNGETTNGTVYAGIVYYDVQGNKVKHHRIDVGPKVALVTPIIEASVLNPYLINSDDAHEYLFFVKEYNDADKIVTYFGIASEKGNMLYKWYTNPKYGSFAGAGLLRNKAQNRLSSLYVNFMNAESPNSYSAVVFYTLPLATLPMNGLGTEANPFVVTNPAQLDNVRNNDTAYYVLGNDIEMAGYTGYQSMGFLPLFNELNKGFKGVFDGKGYTIKNLTMNNEELYVGIFSLATDSAVIRNLIIKNTHFNAPKANSMGTLIATIRGAVCVENCHIEGNLNYTGKGKVGGIVCDASNGAWIHQCSYTGDITALNANAAGGILSSGLTGTKVEACFSKGSIMAKSQAGGIIGSNRSGIVTNCYSAMDVTGGDAMGGLIGSNYGGCLKNYASGKVSSLLQYYKFAKEAGGLAGEVALAMTPGQTKFNVALNPMVTSEITSARVANGGKANNDGIKLLDSNYALSTMKIGLPGQEALVPETDTNNHLDGNNGKSKILAEMDQVFYESIGWNFGKTLNAPWKMVGNYPHLWFEFLVRGLELSEQSLTLDIAATAKLTATVLPSSAENKNVLWESSDPSIVSIDQEGNLKAKKRGTSIITATTEEGDFEQKCEVRVVQAITSIVLDKHELTLKDKERATITATILPQDADNKILKWISNNPAVATIYGGIVIGGEVGFATISVSTEDGKIKDSCIVTVVVPVEKIILNTTELTLKETETAKLTASVRPSGATNKKVSWESIDPSIAIVDSNGLVSGVKKGNTKVIVKSKETPAISAVCEVSVLAKSSISADATNNPLSAYIAGGTLYLKSSLAIEHIRICDVLGRSRFEKTQTANMLEIPIDHLSKGVYVIKTTFTNGSRTSLKIQK